MEKNPEHCMYVLQCIDGTYYTGYTNCLEQRVKTHNAGKGAKYTRCRLPVTCIYYETFETKSAAMSAEYYFKKKKRREKIKYMQERGVEFDSDTNE